MAIVYLERTLIPVDPQPEYIRASGRWVWPIPDVARFPGRGTHAATATSEWWEYAPLQAKPHIFAEGIKLDGVWYWAVPNFRG